MTSINLKVIGLTREGFEPTSSRLEPVTLGFPIIPEWEVGALLIRPTRLVGDPTVTPSVCVMSCQQVAVLIYGGDLTNSCDALNFGRFSQWNILPESNDNI